MWVLIDNYDSFTYILHHYLLQTGHECRVVRNDALSIAALEAMQPSRLILSPGPETPVQAGITLEAIRVFHQRIPILGVCLGHQALGMFFGASLLRAPYPMHGKTSRVSAVAHPLFQGIDTPFDVMRYHSLVVDISASAALVPLAHATDDGTLMALAHRELPLLGVQFHPESVGTAGGQQMLRNWAGMYPDHG